jgi:hypothetical protein
MGFSPVILMVALLRTALYRHIATQKTRKLMRSEDAKFLTNFYILGQSAPLLHFFLFPAPYEVTVGKIFLGFLD